MPEDTACPCCRGAMAVIGHDSSERLDVIPAQFRVLVTRRPKLACRACEGVVVQAPAPARLIEGGLPTEALVAHVLVARYADHLPLYRQAQIMAASRCGAGAVHPGVLGRVCSRRDRARGQPPKRDPAVLGAGVCRRDHRAGARPRPRADQDRLLLGRRPRRPALGRG